MRAPIPAILAFLALLLTAAPAAAQTQAEPEAASGLAPKPLVTAQRHMIVAANPLAAEAGLEMLRRGARRRRLRPGPLEGRPRRLGRPRDRP